MTPTSPLWGLPDPDTAPEFYDDVVLKRLFAWIADSLAILALSILVLPFTAFTGIFFFAAIYMVLGVIYRIVTLTRYSATPGMLLTSIEIRRSDGGRMDATLATLHTLLFTFFSTFFLLQAVSIILMLINDRRQGLHDMLLGTAAVNKSGRL
ncbi:MAG: RDD family protein [Mangrovicoccus sp.]|nr:RDD family protein [Mangrovicoccus sp.]